MEVQHDNASPTTILYTSYVALGQSSDSPKASDYYYSHTSDTVYGSASMPPSSYIPDSEPLSAPAVHADIQHTQTSPNLPSTGLKSFAEPPILLPELQGEKNSNSDTTSRKQEDLSNHLVPSHDSNIQNDASLYDHQLYPSLAVFGNHHMTSSFTEPTLSPPEVFFPVNTMDVDYGSGSGDYLETMSYMGSEGDDYSLVTNLPSDMYEFENSESYDTSFPTRVMIPLSTRYLFPSHSTTVLDRHVTMNPSMVFSINENSASTLQAPSSKFSVSQRPSRTLTLASIPNSLTHVSFSSTVLLGVQAIHPTAVHSSASLYQSIIVSETSESYSNWPDVTIEPSDVLLPDMNSLEYYNIQLTKNNESLTEQRGNQTTSKKFSLPLSVSTTSIYTVPPNHMSTVMYGEDLQPMENNSWPEESSTDLSGFDLSNNTFLDLSDLRPSLINSTFPFLYSSALVPSVDFSTSLWDLVTTDFRISTESTFSAGGSSTSPTVLLPPSDSEESDVMFPNSTNTYWSINSTLPETSFPTSSLISKVFNQTDNSPAVPTESTLDNSSAISVTEMADQGFTGAQGPVTEVTDDGMTTVSKPAFSITPAFYNETTVTTPGPTTEVFNTTPLPATPSLTTQTSTLQTTTVREYLCNITKPDTYLVRVGT